MHEQPRRPVHGQAADAVRAGEATSVDLLRSAVGAHGRA